MHRLTENNSHRQHEMNEITEQKGGIHDRILSAVEQDLSVNSRDDVVKTIEKLGYQVAKNE